MSNTGVYNNRGYNRVRVDLESTKEISTEIRRLELQRNFKVPEPSGSGEMYEEIKYMGENMKLIYEQVQSLIYESGEMLEKMYKPFERADLAKSNSFKGDTR